MSLLSGCWPLVSDIEGILHYSTTVLLIMLLIYRLHTLPPTQLLQSHLSPIHAQQQSLLNAKLQTTASQNASLAEEIRKQREEISSLMGVAEKLVSDLESSGEMMAGVVNGDDGVSARARGAEEILGGM